MKVNLNVRPWPVKSLCDHCNEMATTEVHTLLLCDCCVNKLISKLTDVIRGGGHCEDNSNTQIQYGNG